jgi:hypothetical protein
MNPSTRFQLGGGIFCGRCVFRKLIGYSVLDKEKIGMRIWHTAERLEGDHFFLLTA